MAPVSVKSSYTATVRANGGYPSGGPDALRPAYRSSPDALKVACDAEATLKSKAEGVRFCAHSCHLSNIVADVAKEMGWEVVRCTRQSWEADRRPDLCHVHWLGKCGGGYTQEVFRWVEPWMRVNHFPGLLSALAVKGGLARTLKAYQQGQQSRGCGNGSVNANEFLPETWVLPRDKQELEEQFIDGLSKSAFIVKPNARCQGRGIFITHSYERILQELKGKPIVAQRYVSNPLLLDGLKFDLRLYLLVGAVPSPETGSQGFRGFLFRDGIVRLCTTPYSKPEPGMEAPALMHITNFEVNRFSEDFVFPETEEDDGTGNKRSFQWFFTYIEENYGEPQAARLWTRLCRMCNVMLRTACPTLADAYQKQFSWFRNLDSRCFELMGIDVMVDDTLKPWLLEVNSCPSMSADTPIDVSIKRRLLKQTFALTCLGVDPSAATATYEPRCRKYEQTTADGDDFEPLDLQDFGEYAQVYASRARPWL
eukprot:TRINITY_DN19657_c0_g1_i1.p1 TRINITY_DN19657_c0_g1~~TRINITY_DN19657_c0_g1_i1.p1  ORF type:complete len:481 (+),score=60.34 TRINITY_DN19657_c0_g1_i1:108-1550(+)